MVPTASSSRNRRVQPRWQDRIIACCWLPLRLLFRLWVYFTPTYEEKWGFLTPAQPSAPARSSASHSFLTIALAVACVLGFALIALLTLPPPFARLLLIVAFGIGLRQFMRPKR